MCDRFFVFEMKVNQFWPCMHAQSILAGICGGRMKEGGFVAYVVGNQIKSAIA